MSRVRTLTGKEIELDIEADYKVNRAREVKMIIGERRSADIWPGLADQGKG